MVGNLPLKGVPIKDGPFISLKEISFYSWVIPGDENIKMGFA